LQAPVGDRVNAILITIDTLRADHLGSYGYSKKTDPEIRRHFAEGLRFREALVHTPITRPSHASMLTGMHPAVLGLRVNHQPVDHRLPFLPEILRREGYQTGAVVSGWPLVGPDTGLQRGFDEYSDAFSPLLKANLALADHTLLIVLSKLRLIETVSRKASATSDDAIDWLRRVHEHPFFLWVHYYDPHHLYEPPPEFSLRMGRAPEAPRNSRQYFSRVSSGEKEIDPEERSQATALYDGEILFTDSQIGRLLDAVAELGLDARTVVLLTADHGETLHERVESEGMALTHGWWINQRDVRVPFLLRGPGIPPGESAVIAQSYDVAPTLLGALGIDIPDGMMGRDLLSPAVPPPSFEDPIMALSAGREDWKGLVSARAGDWKYILDVTKGTGTLFDLGADPGETHDFAASRPEIASQLREAAELLPLETADESDLSPAELDRLRALGYVH
jgi:arylsulfatase A-like enzyme